MCLGCARSCALRGHRPPTVVRTVYWAVLRDVPPTWLTVAHRCGAARAPGQLRDRRAMQARRRASGGAHLDARARAPQCAALPTASAKAGWLARSVDHGLKVDATRVRHARGRVQLRVHQRPLVDHRYVRGPAPALLHLYPARVALHVAQVRGPTYPSALAAKVVGVLAACADHLLGRLPRSRARPRLPAVRRC
eukprot:6178510-Pleurochrysis_carterae.AAC.9